MKRIIALIMAFLCILGLCACGDGSKSESASEERTLEEIASQEKTITISTPYVDLKVPESFDKDVYHEETGQKPYVISFHYKPDKTELFSLIFNGTGDYLFGTLIGEEENTVIYLNIPNLDEDSKNYKKKVYYQEQMNLILGYLTSDYEVVTNEVVEYENSETYDIKTPVVTLKYPKRWKGKVKTKVLDDGVKFSADGKPLFDLMFKKCDGYLLGTYKDKPIYMVEYPVEDEDHIAMQAGVNVILEYLMQDSDFEISHK